MQSLFLIILIFITALFIYKKRFTSEFNFGGMHFIQFYYFIVAPVIVILFINAALDIIRRPEAINFPLPSNLMFILFAFSLILGAMGVAIHSTSTTVYEAFKRGKDLQSEVEKKAYKINELYHQSLSHNLVYLGSLGGLLMLGLLELNHPRMESMANFNLTVALGITLGIVGTIGILRGAHVGFEIVASFFGSVILGYSVRTYALDTTSYPIAFASLAAMVTVFSLLSLTTIIFLISESLSKRVVKRTFPKGHPFHENINLKVLTLRIQKSFNRDRKKLY